MRARDARKNNECCRHRPSVIRKYTHTCRGTGTLTHNNIMRHRCTRERPDAERAMRRRSGFDLRVTKSHAPLRACLFSSRCASVNVCVFGEPVFVAAVNAHVVRPTLCRRRWCEGVVAMCVGTHDIVVLSMLSMLMCWWAQIIPADAALAFDVREVAVARFSLL